MMSRDSGKQRTTGKQHESLPEYWQLFRRAPRNSCERNESLKEPRFVPPAPDVAWYPDVVSVSAFKEGRASAILLRGRF